MKKDNFTRNTILLIAGAVLFYVVLGKPILNQTGYGYSPEVIAYTQNQLHKLDDEGLETLLQSAAGRPNLLFLYASWCPYCQTQFKELANVKQLVPEEKLNIAYISLDQNPHELGAYLMKSHPNATFIAYHVPDNNKPNFLDALRSHGAEPGSGIPQMLFFDKTGTFSSLHKGLQKADALVKRTERLQ